MTCGEHVCVKRGEKCLIEEMLCLNFVAKLNAKTRQSGLCRMGRVFQKQARATSALPHDDVERDAGIQGAHCTLKWTTGSPAMAMSFTKATTGNIGMRFTIGLQSGLYLVWHQPRIQSLRRIWFQIISTKHRRLYFDLKYGRSLPVKPSSCIEHWKITQFFVIRFTLLMNFRNQFRNLILKGDLSPRTRNRN